MKRIQYLVLAIVVLAIIFIGLGFIKGSFCCAQLPEHYEEPSPPPASINYPITLSRDILVITPNDKTKFLKISIHNTIPHFEMKDVISCIADENKIRPIIKNVRALGESNDQRLYEIEFYFEKFPAGKTFLCSFNIRSNDKSVRRDFIVLAK